MLELQARESQRPDSAGNQIIPIEYEVIKKNGVTTNVLVYRDKQFFYDLQAISDIIIDFQIWEEKVYTVTTYFKDLSVEYIKKKFEKNYGDRAWEGLYFTEDFQYFTTVTLENEMASITRWKSTPSNVGRYTWGDVRLKQEEYKKKHLKD